MIRPASILVATALIAGCGRAPETKRTPPDAPTRAEYTKALTDFGLTRAGLGRDWIAAAEQALAAPVTTTLPFRETGYLAPDAPAAVGYRFEARRGRKIIVELTFESATPASPPPRVFLDLFQLAAPGSSEPPALVAEADPGATTLEYEVRRDAQYVIRIQPEILRGGRYTSVHRSDASLAFPVPGLSLAAIHSNFGVPRDAGRRDHHGVDIFAPRGTPVVAAVDGAVSNQVSNLGGQVVWLRDARWRRSIYYAHLHDWAVADGAQVKAGDVIGYVGNTGNARTTPPHLHFGVYERGPADPYPFLQPADRPAAKVTAPVERLQTWGRARGRSVRLHDRASSQGSVSAPLDPARVFRIVGASAQYFRVLLPDGDTRYLPSADVVPASRPVSSLEAR